LIMPELSGHMLHFAYGEDLAHERFLKACPGAEWFGPARMEGHRLVFMSDGRINVCTDSRAEVWGALWLVPAALLPVLDQAAGEGRVRTTRRIISPAGPRTEATVYIVPENAMTGAATVVPTAVRLQAWLAAAKENRLPAAYVNEIKALGGGKKQGKDSH
jgi:gamma-glutamylcyclotransferase (GGCT)/AIG2-like uncharacterized protein YtfP